MSEWKNKLDVFLSDFEYIDDVVGVLVCGSYITGHPTKHSDLDVHIVLDNDVAYRERGNRIIDGLLIEYFANPLKQILCYFNDDLKDKSLMSQTQFVTGKIILDTVGDVATLKEKAQSMIADFYDSSQTIVSISDLDKYFFWDMLDDLQDAYETQKPDFDFMYFTRLNMLIEKYMAYINLPYNSKTVYGNITSPIVRDKYLLKELPDSMISRLIAKAITAIEKSEKMKVYNTLTTTIINNFGGFNIDGFKFKGDVSL
ncbi:MAG: nucleotidyltransferase domain-containing protein [Defluviitaleaceae bacterium]|nr:nucleotidyltransferase domain-containing protein [Defluviitaleaceae bacterium]